MIYLNVLTGFLLAPMSCGRAMLYYLALLAWQEPIAAPTAFYYRNLLHILGVYAGISSTAPREMT